MTVSDPAYISYIIPAFNEESSIAETLHSIIEGEIKFPYEIIVVDHNSTDKTVEIASALGASVINAKGGTIASVRNLGVLHSKGNLIVFLDADISLTEQWFKALPLVVEQLLADPMIVTGSHCNAPDNGNWIEQNWFNNYVHEVDTDNLGTGHMIMSRKLFDSINGFDESLVTGEDYSFCMSVLASGGKIINNKDLYVVHRDYPENSWQFIQREAWHGMGDVTSLNAVIRSKVALAALIFMMLHAIVFIAVFVPAVPFTVAPLGLLAIVGLLLFSSWKKYGHCSYHVILINSAIFYLYFIGRSLSYLKSSHR